MNEQIIEVGIESTFSNAFEKQMHLGFTIAQLRAAFEIVTPLDNWKHAIAAVVSVENVCLYKTAIEFFVGGPTTITYRKNGEAQISNAGYYANIGA